MSLANDLRSVWKAIFHRDEIGRIIGPPRGGQSIPNDIGLKLDFPTAVDTPERKILYTLRREGEQCYCNLRLLSDLEEDDAKKALRELIKRGRVKKTTDPKSPVLLETEELNSFRLIR